MSRYRAYRIALGSALAVVLVVAPLISVIWQVSR